jgi:hypothetical protein
MATKKSVDIQTYMNQFSAKLKRHFPDNPEQNWFEFSDSGEAGRINKLLLEKQYSDSPNSDDLLQVPELNRAPWEYGWNRDKFKQFMNKYYSGSSFHDDQFPVIGYGGDFEGIDSNYTMVTISAENPIVRIIIFGWPHCNEMAIEELGWSKEFVSVHRKHYYSAGICTHHDLVFLEHEWGSSKFCNKIPGLAFPSDVGMRLVRLTL